MNYTRAAELAALIRANEESLVVSIGGEIGEVGKQNSTPDELRAYLDGFNRGVRRPGRRGCHRPLQGQRPDRHLARWRAPADGGVAEVKLDFEVLRELGEVAREYGLAGAVQHGASTLPDELFHRFPEVETAEIHLATGFQNALYEHPAFPAELHARIEQYCFDNLADERSEGQTDAQFVYKTRKKALGEIKRELWDLETKDEIIASQQAKMKYPLRAARHPRQQGHRREVRQRTGAAQAGPGRPQGVVRPDGLPSQPTRALAARRRAASSPGLARVPAAVVPVPSGRHLSAGDNPDRIGKISTC